MSSGFEILWDTIDLVQCITLRDRPERRAAAAAQFAAVGLSDRVEFLLQERDVEDGKRGCFVAHQAAAEIALDRGARIALTFEDDVEFMAHFTPHVAARAAAFLRQGNGLEWDIFFLGHFPRRMVLTSAPDIVQVRSMDAHAYVLSSNGMRDLCSQKYAGEQVDAQYHYGCAAAFALYPMVALQTPGPSDTEGLRRADDWNDDKLRREQELYKGCVERKALSHALGVSQEELAAMGVLSGVQALQSG